MTDFTTKTLVVLFFAPIKLLLQNIYIVRAFLRKSYIFLMFKTVHALPFVKYSGNLIQLTATSSNSVTCKEK